MPQKHKFIVKPLFLQVRDEIATRIAAREWKAGGLLPNEHALAEMFGVSPGTIRRALELLESEKVVSRQQGRGTMVVDHDTEEMGIRFSSIYKDETHRISGHITWHEAEFSTATSDEQHILGTVPSERVLRIRRVRAYHDHPFMYEEVVILARHFPGIAEDTARNARLASIAQKHGLQLTHAVEAVSPILCPVDVLGRLGLEQPIPVLQLQRRVFAKGGFAVEYRNAICHLREKQYLSVTS